MRRGAGDAGSRARVVARRVGAEALQNEVFGLAQGCNGVVWCHVIDASPRTRVQEGGEVRREATAFVGIQIVPGPTPGKRVEGYHAANELGHVCV